MIVTVNLWIPPNLPDGTYYLVNVDKGNGLNCRFVVEIVKLAEEMHSFFYDQYEQHIVENKFLTVNFFDFKKLGLNNRYVPVTGMNFTRRELEQFVENGLAEAVFDFVATQLFYAIVAIPTHKVLSMLYHKVLSENEQEIGYCYNQSYVKEQKIHVIES